MEEFPLKMSKLNKQEETRIDKAVTIVFYYTFMVRFPLYGTQWIFKFDEVHLDWKKY